LPKGRATVRLYLFFTSGIRSRQRHYSNRQFVLWMMPKRYSHKPDDDLTILLQWTDVPDN